MDRLTYLSAQKKDYSIVIFLLVSMGLHAGSLFVAAYLTRPEPEKPATTIEIEIPGEPDQPPPLGTNDTETGPPPEEPTPPPMPEDTPPPPIVPNDFEVPEEDATPAPATTPKVVPKNTPKPGPAGTPSFNPNARPGAIKGVDAQHGGVAGGKGEVKSKGGKADFTSTPNMTIPANLRQRLGASGFKLAPTSASISYSNGEITSVNITRSSGNAALDAQMVRHVTNNFRVVAGRSGKATLPVSIRL